MIQNPDSDSHDVVEHWYRHWTLRKEALEDAEAEGELIPQEERPGTVKDGEGKFIHRLGSMLNNRPGKSGARRQRRPLVMGRPVTKTEQPMQNTSLPGMARTEGTRVPGPGALNRGTLPKLSNPAPTNLRDAVAQGSTRPLMRPRAGATVNHRTGRKSGFNKRNKRRRRSLR